MRFPFSILLAAASVSTALAEPRPWKSADGSKSIAGEFIKRADDKVTIRSEAGKELEIEIAKLHEDDRKWLNIHHPVPGADPDPSAVFDTLMFGDTRETTLEKLKASKIVEMTTGEAFIGRSGLNGIFRTRQKIGGLDGFLYFDWTESGKLNELTLQTETLPVANYKSQLEPSWKEFVELLSMLYGKPVQKGPMPSAASVPDGAFAPSHFWELESGGGALLGTARDGEKYQLVVRFTQKRVRVVELP